MKILYHHVVATPEQSSYYYAERFNPPYLLVSPYGDGLSAGLVSGFNHRQEFIEHPLGKFSTKELISEGLDKLVSLHELSALTGYAIPHLEKLLVEG
jgi:hypothetical protein